MCAKDSLTSVRSQTIDTVKEHWAESQVILVLFLIKKKITFCYKINLIHHTLQIVCGIKGLFAALANLFAHTHGFKLKLMSKTFYSVLVFNSEKFMTVGEYVSQFLFVIAATVRYLKQIRQANNLSFLWLKLQDVIFKLSSELTQLSNTDF